MTIKKYKTSYIGFNIAVDKLFKYINIGILSWEFELIL